MKQVVAFSLVVVAVVLFLSCGGGTAVKETAAGLPAGPHPVVIIAIDGLRADALGVFGALVSTPSFDALAAERVKRAGHPRGRTSSLHHHTHPITSRETLECLS